MRSTFSVIIPTLRREEQLRETLASLAACDPLPDELIVIDAAPERSAEAHTTGIAELGVRVQVLSSPGGVSRQRNIGLGKASGELVVFLDDDVLVQRRLFEIADEIFTDTTIVAATGRIEEPRSRRLIAHESRVRRFLPGGGREGQYTRYGYPNYLRDPYQARDVEFMPGCLMCVRREAAVAVGFDERLALAEDEDFAYRLTRLGRVRHDPRLTVIHRKLGFRSRDRREFDRSLLISRLYIFRKNFEQRPLARLQFGALSVALLLHRLVNLDLQGALGVRDSMRWAVSHRGEHGGSPPLPRAIERSNRVGEGDLLRLLCADGKPMRVVSPDLAAGAGDAGDLVVLRAHRGWLRRRNLSNVAALARSIPPQGAVYLSASPLARWTVGHALQRGGLRRAAAFVQRPHPGPPRLLVPLEASAGRYASQALAPSRPAVRLASNAAFSRLLRRPVRTLAPGIGLLYSREGEQHRLDWLGFGGAAPSPASTLLMRTRTGARILTFERGETEPVTSAFIGPSERGTVSKSAESARDSAAQAGVLIPRKLAAGWLEDRSVLVESAVPGTLAAARLMRRPHDLLDALDRITTWIERWHELTSQPAALTDQLASAKILEAARELEPILGGAYLERLERFCKHLSGTEIPLVAVHGDLTMWNVLLDAGSAQLGVVDWETADASSLPIGDLAYAAVDMCAATDGYQNRAAAFEECFSSTGSLAAAVGARMQRVIVAAAPSLLRCDLPSMPAGFTTLETRDADSWPTRMGRSSRSRGASRAATASSTGSLWRAIISDLRVLFVSPFPPSAEAHGGGPKEAGRIVRALAALCEVRVICLRAGGEQGAGPEFARAGVIVEEIDRGPLARPGLERALRSPRIPLGWARGNPRAVTALWLPEFARRLSTLNREWRPHLVHFEHIHMCRYLDAIEPPIPRVVRALEPAAEAARANAAQASGVRALVARGDAALLSRFERRAVGAVDTLIVLSERDLASYARLGTTTPIVRLGLTFAVPEDAPDSRHSDDRTVAFVANYAHAPNVVAARTLAVEILPRIRAELPDSRLLLVGEGSERLGLASAQVIATGRVESIAEALESAAVVAIPLRTGGGMRVKVFEALALGKAVVASRLAAAGLEALDGEHLLLAETDTEFANAIAGLLRDRPRRLALGAAARAWALERAGADDAAVKLLEVYRNLAAPGRGRSGACGPGA